MHCSVRPAPAKCNQYTPKRSHPRGPYPPQVPSKKNPTQGGALSWWTTSKKVSHPITEELKRWYSIIGERYLNHNLEKRRNGLVDKPKEYTPLII